MTLRVSASQINVFLNEPAIWVLNKFYETYGEFGAPAKLGIAVEKGLESVLVNDFDYDTALNWAYEVFDKDTEATTDRDDVAECRSRLDPMLKQAVEIFLNLGDVKDTQIRLEGEIEGVGILGFADFDFGDFFIDLKTSKRCPSCVENLSAEHMRQLTIYKILTGKPQKIAYFTNKKCAVFEPTEKQYKIAEFEIRNAIKAMRMIWDMGTDDAVTLLPPRNMGSFYWDEKTLTKAREVWR